MRRLVPAIALVALILLLLGGGGEVRHGVGVVAPREPVQVAIENAASFQVGEARLTPQARFEVEARILSTKRYRWDAGAFLSPVDFALGWGRMSDEQVLDELEIWQRSRWFRYQADRWPITHEEIQVSASNMHLIPADDYVQRTLLDARVGEVIALRGTLVNAERDDGWRWNSSLRRDDTGAGACELFYVEQAFVVRGR